MCKHEQAISSSSSRIGGISNVPQRPFMLFTGSNVSIHIRKKQSAEFLITARADWAMGYKSMGDQGSLLNAIETKQRSEFDQRAKLSSRPIWQYCVRTIAEPRKSTTGPKAFIAMVPDLPSCASRKKALSDILVSSISQRREN